MKKIIAFIFLFITVTAPAQNVPAYDTTSRPAITKPGKPIGKIVEKMMNKDGDSLISGDGNLKLIIPPGALSKKTTISIQAMTNMMPNGNGLAYRLEPSGIQFQQPIQIVFHYDTEESKESAQLLMGIAMQDDKGQWYGLYKFNLDTVAKTISGDINHFSVWATFNQLELISLLDQKRVKVTMTCPVGIFGIDMSPKQEAFQDKLTELLYGPLVIYWQQPKSLIWRVNNVVKGNSLWGTLNVGEEDESTGKKWKKYTAPGSVPGLNPVTISVELVGAHFKLNGKDQTGPLKLSLDILIYDNAYEVKIESKQQGSQYSYIDKGSFVISLNGENTKIIETVNNSPDILDVKDECSHKVINPGANHGHIHITGTKSIKLTPAQPPNFTLVEITFIEAPMVYSTFLIQCMVNGKLVSMTTEKANAFVAKYSAWPLFIKFEAKEGEQVIVDTQVPGGYYKVTVRRLKDEEYEK